jgi:nicotinate-nucleotide adenylyltransferase
MRVAVYGGSFNPPHVGHAMVAAWLRWTDHADEVWLLPTFAHPFAKDLAPWSDRLRMSEALAAAVGPWVRVCTLESELPVPSYTIDTLTELQRRHPEHTLRLVVGADILPETAEWRRWDEIVARFSPVVVGRQGWPTPRGAVDFPGVSSTEVRARIRRGDPVTHLLPAAVRAHALEVYAERPTGSERSQ